MTIFIDCSWSAARVEITVTHILPAFKAWQDRYGVLYSDLPMGYCAYFATGTIPTVAALRTLIDPSLWPLLVRAHAARIVLWMWRMPAAQRSIASAVRATECELAPVDLRHMDTLVKGHSMTDDERVTARAGDHAEHQQTLLAHGDCHTTCPQSNTLPPNPLLWRGNI